MSSIITLESSDQMKFFVAKEALISSWTIVDFFQYNDTDIMHLDLPCRILAIVVDFCKEYELTNDLWNKLNPGDLEETMDTHKSESEMKWYDVFIEKHDCETLFGVVKAAHDLKIKKLLKVTCKCIHLRSGSKYPSDVESYFPNKWFTSTSTDDESDDELPSWTVYRPKNDYDFLSMYEIFKKNPRAKVHVFLVNEEKVSKNVFKHLRTTMVVNNIMGTSRALAYIVSRQCCQNRNLVKFLLARDEDESTGDSGDSRGI